MQQISQRIVQSPPQSDAATWAMGFETQTQQRNKKGSGEYGDMQPQALAFENATGLMNPEQLLGGACFASPSPVVLNGSW